MFTYTVSDFDGDTATATLTITVANVNDDPVITSGSAVNVAEGSTAVTTVTATDTDGDTLSFSIDTLGGADHAAFSVDSVTGVLTFQAPPDFEIPGDSDSDNVYEVTVQVSDGQGGTESQLISVTVTNVNEGSPTANPDVNAATEGGSAVAGNVLGNTKIAQRQGTPKPPTAQS